MDGRDHRRLIGTKEPQPAIAMGGHDHLAQPDHSGHRRAGTDQLPVVLELTARKSAVEAIHALYAA